MGRIGSDPEAIILIGDKRISAASYFNDGDVGHDGAGIPLEFRPRPGNDTDEHLSNLEDCIQKCKDMIDMNDDLSGKAKVFGGGWKGQFSIGGHIHLEASRTEQNQHAATHINALMFLFNSLTGGEDFINRRIHDHYGSPLEIRTPSHGFEIRSPDSWLSSKSWAGAYLSFAKVAFENHPAIKKYFSKIYTLSQEIYGHLEEHADEGFDELNDDDDEEVEIRETPRANINLRKSKEVRALLIEILSVLLPIAKEKSKSEVKHLEFALNAIKEKLIMDTSKDVLKEWTSIPKGTIDIKFASEKYLLEIRDMLPQNVYQISSRYTVIVYGTHNKRGDTIWLGGHDKIYEKIIKNIKGSKIDLGIGTYGRYRREDKSKCIYIGIPLKVRKDIVKSTQIVRNIIDEMEKIERGD